jgi:hypothetical protein
VKRPSIDTRTLLAVAAAAALIVAYAWIVALSEDFYLVDAPGGSTFSSAPEGLRVFYAYLDEIGVERSALQRFDELPQSGTIVFAAASPPARDITRAEIARIESWVENGGRLVLAGPYAGELVGDRFAARRTGGTEEPAPLRPLLPSAYTAQVRLVDAGEDRMLTSSPAWATHLKDLTGQALVTRSVGRGEVVWLAGVHPLSNGGIGAADNARLATALVVGAGPVYFDEYHHGFVDGGGVWERLGSGGRAAAILALLAIASLLWAASRRIGPVIAPAEVKTARRGGYIASLAGLYRSAGAHRSALDSLADGLRSSLIRRYGTLEVGLARHPQAVVALERVSSAGERIVESEFVSIARDIARVRKEVDGRDG